MADTTLHAGTVEHIDPQALVIEANVRPSAPLTAAFVQSVRENGVLTRVTHALGLHLALTEGREAMPRACPDVVPSSQVERSDSMPGAHELPSG